MEVDEKKKKRYRTKAISKQILEALDKLLCEQNLSKNYELETEFLESETNTIPLDQAIEQAGIDSNLLQRLSVKNLHLISNRSKIFWISQDGKKVGRRPVPVAEECMVYADNLPSDLPTSWLESRFSLYGTILKTCRPKNGHYAVVTFSSADAVTEICRQHPFLKLADPGPQLPSNGHSSMEPDIPGHSTFSRKRRAEPEVKVTASDVKKRRLELSISEEVSDVKAKCRRKRRKNFQKHLQSRRNRVIWSQIQIMPYTLFKSLKGDYKQLQKSRASQAKSMLRKSKTNKGGTLPAQDGSVKNDRKRLRGRDKLNLRIASMKEWDR